MSAAGRSRALRLAVATRIKARLANRGDLLAGLIGGALLCAVGPAFVLTLFQHVTSLGTWSGPEVLFCWGFADTCSGLFYVFFQGLYVLNQRYILGGELDRLLLRPMDPYLQLLVDNISLEDLPVVVLGLLIMGGAVLWGLPPAPLWRWLLLPIALLSGTAVLGGLLTAFACLGFHLRHRGTAVGMVLQLSTFVRYPLDLFANPLRWLLTTVLPLGFAGFYGAILVLGRAQFAWIALLQPVVAAACLGLGYGAWRLGQRVYASSGS